MIINKHIDIESPCIRHCCLDDNDVCMGCFRTLDEIKDWQMKSDDEKAAVLDRCQLRRSQSSSRSIRPDKESKFGKN